MTTAGIKPGLVNQKHYFRLNHTEVVSFPPLRIQTQLIVRQGSGRVAGVAIFCRYPRVLLELNALRHSTPQRVPSIII